MEMPKELSHWAGVVNSNELGEDNRPRKRDLFSVNQQTLALGKHTHSHEKGTGRFFAMLNAAEEKTSSTST
jgi:hypothetical protein